MSKLAGAEAAKLEKFSDAGGTKSGGCPTLTETDSSGCFGISCMAKELHGSIPRFEELLPEGKEFLRSGKGRQVPCRKSTDSSLDPALKDRDCAELPVHLVLRRLWAIRHMAASKPDETSSKISLDSEGNEPKTQVSTSE